MRTRAPLPIALTLVGGCAFGALACSSTVGDPGGGFTAGTSVSTGTDPSGSSAGASAGSAASGSAGAGLSGSVASSGSAGASGTAGGTGRSGSASGTGAVTGAPSGGTSGAASGTSASGQIAGGSGRDGGVSGATGHTGSTGGSGSGGPTDAGMHRDAAPVVLTGCAAQVPTAIFGASCELNTCHNSMPAPAGMAYLLDLQSPGVASRLVNVTAIEEPSLKLIDPINPANSWILAKVKDMQPPVGLQMPEMGAKLTAAQIACLEQWVDAEAAGPY